MPPSVVHGELSGIIGTTANIAHDGCPRQRAARARGGKPSGNPAMLSEWYFRTSYLTNRKVSSALPPIIHCEGISFNRSSFSRADWLKYDVSGLNCKCGDISI